jgi:hypothetical protein
MAFAFKFSRHFVAQWDCYDTKTKDIVKKKLCLVKQNPFRYPTHEGYRFVFKVKLTIENKYSRLIYAVFMPDKEHITILGVFDRKVGYKDFERMFKDLKK